MSSLFSTVNLETLLNRLNHVQARADGRGWYAQCPAHETGSNRKNNLSVWVDGGGVIRLKCWAGCHKEAVLSRLGMVWQDLYPVNYDRRAATKSWAAPPTPPRPKKFAGEQDWAHWLDHCRSDRCHEKWLSAFAQSMGPAVTFSALDRLGCAVEFDGNEWRMLTPERDQTGREIGLAVRWIGGQKRQKPGSHRGLIYETFFLARLRGPVLMPEGGSDTAAALAAGLSAVGRPSNTGGLELSAALLSEPAVAAHEIIVLGENDRKPDGSHPGAAGREFAQKLADRLNRPVHFAYPPDDAKDLREWLGRHGSDGQTFLARLKKEELKPRPKPEEARPPRRPEELCFFVSSDLFERKEDLARVAMHLRCGRNSGCDGCLRRKRRLWREHLAGLFHKAAGQGRFHVACVLLQERGRVSKALRDYCKPRGLKPTAVFFSVRGGWLQVISAHPFAGSTPTTLSFALGLLEHCLCNEEGREIAVPVGKKRTRFVWARGAWVMRKEKKEPRHRKLGRMRDGASLRLAAEVRDWKYSDERPDDTEAVRKEAAIPKAGVTPDELAAFDREILVEILVHDRHGASNLAGTKDTTIVDEPGSAAEARQQTLRRFDRIWEWVIEKISWQKN